MPLTGEFFDQDEPSQLFGYVEAARRLRKSPSWLQKQVAQRKVPHRKIGASVMFTPEDLAQIVQESYQPAGRAHG